MISGIAGRRAAVNFRIETQPPARICALVSGTPAGQGRGMKNPWNAARPLALIVLWLGGGGSIAAAAGTSPPLLRVDASGRFLAREDGRPFFWLGDTAWELLHRLNREETLAYLDKRAAQGFTVIQTVVLAELDGLRVPNANGDLPLENLDPTRPNEAYFRHVDFVVRAANARGLYLGLLPTWGDKVKRAWGAGPEIFNVENARAYGEFLGRRYRDAGLVWILGGDRSPVGDEAVWGAMARGLRAGDGGRHLITGHWADGRVGRGSSPFFHREPWLDFNLAYSGHAWAAPNYRQIARDYALRPIKPTLDGEPRYEDHPYIGDGSGFYSHRKRWDQITRGNAQQMRQAAYWALLAGAAGHTYGCHDVWQFYDGKRDPITHAITPWRRALDFPGARQMGLMRRLFESLPWTRLTPDPSLIVGGQGEGEHHAQAARARDGSFLLVYLPLGDPVTIRLSDLTGPRLRARWFNPRTGEWTPLGALTPEARHAFTPPRRGRTWDWVLLVETASAPGKS
jgi:hypothetical protein